MQLRGVVGIFERGSVFFADALRGYDIPVATRANELLSPPLGRLCARRISHGMEVSRKTIGTRENKSPAAGSGGFPTVQLSRFAACNWAQPLPEPRPFYFLNTLGTSRVLPRSCWINLIQSGFRGLRRAGGEPSLWSPRRGVAAARCIRTKHLAGRGGE
jgi:hypothetical protein